VGTVLDTTVFIELERSMEKMPAERAMTKVAEHLEVALGVGEEVGIAAVTASELLHGVHRATAKHRARRGAFVEAVISVFPSLSFDLLAARAHARLWAGLVASGAEVGAHDRLIAATAMSVGWRVGTANTRHFDPIPGLDVVTINLAQA
jgi:predicted nucleic acid-binding protein